MFGNGSDGKQCVSLNRDWELQGGLTVRPGVDHPAAARSLGADMRIDLQAIIAEALDCLEKTSFGARIEHEKRKEAA